MVVLKKNPKNKKKKKSPTLENLGIINFISASDSCAVKSRTLCNLDDTPDITGDGWDLLELRKPKREFCTRIKF